MPLNFNLECPRCGCLLHESQESVTREPHYGIVSVVKCPRPQCKDITASTFSMLAAPDLTAEQKDEAKDELQRILAAKETNNEETP